MSDFESGSFDAVIDKGTIIIAVLDSIMDATANICKLMPNMSLISNPFLLFAGTLDSLMVSVLLSGRFDILPV